jgi:dipeptidyl aminopeptidase/acylaminoacyl peptidase
MRASWLLVLAVSATSFAHAQTPDFERARTLPQRAGGAAFNVKPTFQWVPGTAKVFWVSQTASGRSFWWADAEARKKALLFDHEELAKKLAEVAEKPVDPKAIPLINIEWRDGNSFIGDAFDARWLVTLDPLKVEAGPALTAPPSAELSPDGKTRLRLNETGNLELVRGSERPQTLTTDASPEREYGVFYWSPDSKTAVAYRTTPGDRLKMFRIRSIPESGVRPQLVEQTYDLPGDKLDSSELIVIDAATGKMKKAATDSIDFWDLPLPWWSPDGKTFRIDQLHRGYQRERIIEIDRQTGAARTVIDEKTDTFLMPSYSWAHESPDEVLWASERDGWRHLYAIDARTGAVKRQLTKGNWVVRDVAYVGDDRLVFSANGREADRDPYFLNWYSLDLKNPGEPKLLTPEPANHTGMISPDGRFLIDSFSTVDIAPEHALRDAKTGEILVHLEQADISQWQAQGFRPAESFHTKGRDDKTEIYGLIYRPTDFDKTKKYPVVEYIYNGPHDAYVPKSWFAYDRCSMLAELGFVVVMIDGMGTAHRGKEFHRVSYKNLGDSGLPDHMKWIKAAAAKYAEMDLSKGVGIFGYSAGGYDSAHALLTHPEFYTVAVSLAGNHDHRTDKVWWNELWMGYPVGPNYAEQSNVTLAPNLKGKLFLICGEQDDNVNPHAATMQLVDALVKADKDFDMLYLPGRTHNLGGWYVDRKIFEYFVKNLK